jgi:hypothetical protein
MDTYFFLLLNEKYLLLICLNHMFWCGRHLDVRFSNFPVKTWDRLMVLVKAPVAGRPVSGVGESVAGRGRGDGGRGGRGGYGRRGGRGGSGRGRGRQDR